MTADADGGAGGFVDPIRWAQRKAVVVACATSLATLALVFGLMALSAAARGVATTSATPWIVVLLVCSVLMGLICVAQGRLWQQTLRRWATDPSANGPVRLSWVFHVASYPVVVLGIFAGIAASHDVGFAGAVANWSTLALVPLIAAQVLGAVQNVRRDGPPGTVPTHVRRLAARIERSRRED